MPWLLESGFMSTLSQVEKISQKYAVPAEEFIRSGAIMNLREKQRLLKIERFEILSRYRASNVEELNQKITESNAPEHPAWEDLIEVKNIEEEIKEIENIQGGVLMLNLKEQTIKELDELKPQALAKVYDLITELKRINQPQKSKSAAADYIKVREALKQCKGSLSEDIILEREDRI